MTHLEKPSSLLQQSQSRLHEIRIRSGNESPSRSQRSSNESAHHQYDAVASAAGHDTCKDASLCDNNEDNDVDNISVTSTSENSTHSTESSEEGSSPMLKLALIFPFLMISLALIIAYIGRRETNELFVQDGASRQDHWMHDTETIHSGPNSSLSSEERSTPVVADSGIAYLVSQQAAQQIQNYRAHQGLLLHLQIPLTAGHAVCRLLGHAKHHKTPGPDCFHFADDKEEEEEDHANTNMTTTTTTTTTGYPAYYPWNYEETAPNLEFVLQYYDFLTWRLPGSRLDTTIVAADTNWELSNLASIVVLRDPLARLLAFQPQAAEQWPTVFQNNNKDSGQEIYHAPATKEAYNREMGDWWGFAKSSYTDNAVLRALLGNPDDCCHKKHFQAAQLLVRRMTIVLNMACLQEGFVATADLLGMQLSLTNQKAVPVEHAPPEQRMPPPIFQYLKRKNKWDIEFYEWAAQTLALVKCSNSTK